MAVSWATGVNTRIKRNGTSWGTVQKFITDGTRSGKQKRRLSNSMEKRQFSVSMRFNLTEYGLFETWFDEVILGGLYSFNFPQIDASGTVTMKEYRFADGGSPQYSNPSGNNIDCSMVWEEV